MYLVTPTKKHKRKQEFIGDRSGSVVFPVRLIV